MFTVQSHLMHAYSEVGAILLLPVANVLKIAVLVFTLSMRTKISAP